MVSPLTSILSSPGSTQIRTLARDFTLTVPLPQPYLVYKWVAEYLKLGGISAMD